MTSSHTALSAMLACCTISLASCLTCLSCDQISQPRHCHYVETCKADEMCGAQRQFSLSGQNTYTLGCVPKAVCSNATGAFCSECCGGDLCNAALCGEPDYPATRGPVCYDCDIHTKQHPCRHIDFCSVDEACSLLGVEEFGDIILTSSCKPKHSCITNTSTPRSPLVGKRSLSHVACESCCSDDLCNLDCSAGGPCASSPCVNGVCNETATGFQCNCFPDWGGRYCNQSLTFDCKDILDKGFGSTDGVYSVKLKQTGEIIQVFCDMTSDGGGWTVFQKRFNGSESFYRTFKEYENGFGSVSGEYWLGLKYIYQMTNGVTTELRLDLEKSTGQTGYAVYQTFALSNPPRYILDIGTYSGTAGDSGRGLSYNDGYGFTTYDKDDSSSGNNCGVKDHGGWWYSNCAYVNLNGEYITPGTQFPSRGERGVTHRAFDSERSLKSTEMKFRRK